MEANDKDFDLRPQSLRVNNIKAVALMTVDRRRGQFYYVSLSWQPIAIVLHKLYHAISIIQRRLLFEVRRDSANIVLCWTSDLLHGQPILHDKPTANHLTNVLSLKALLLLDKKQLRETYVNYGFIESA